MAYQDNTNSQLILTIGAVSGFVIIVVVIGLQAWFMREEQLELEDKYGAAINYELTDLRTAQHANLDAYHWVDKDKKFVGVPINEAMKMLVASGGKLPQ